MKKISFVISILILQSFGYSFSFSSLNTDSLESLSIPEVPEISAGAEYSFKLQRAINSNNYSDFQFKNSLQRNNKISQSEIFTIEGISYEDEADSSGFFHVPPDPHGAAGPSHIVSVVNTSIQWFTKAGVKENTQRFGKNSSTDVGSFFESLSPITGAFDPKVIYDQYDERFVVVALEMTEDIERVSVKSSRIFVAVSDDDNPNGTWYYHAIDSKISINSIDHWADYPGLAVDDNAIYITANMYEFDADGSDFGGVRLWIINKSPFYSNGSASVSIYDPHTAAGVGDFATTTQPAHMFGIPPGNLGTFLTYYSGINNGLSEYVGVITVSDPLGTPSFSNQFVFVQNIDLTDSTSLPDAPQMDTTATIEVNDRRSLNAVWRNGFLWLTTTLLPVSGDDVGQTTAHWFKISTAIHSTLLLDDQGNVGGEDIAPGTFTFFPSLAVNDAGDMVIGFSASAPGIYPSAYFAGRFSSDPSGTVGSSRVLREGLDYYIRTFGGSRNRWGDYSGISVDPSDGTKFWLFNEYARTRGNVSAGEDGRWGTAFGEAPISVVDVKDRENNNFKNFFFNLSQNYPNPFNPTTIINFVIPKSSFVNLKVYNVLGGEVATLINGEKSTGIYETVFNADNLSSGIYFYKIEVTPLNGEHAFKESRKMILMK